MGIFFTTLVLTSPTVRGILNLACHNKLRFVAFTYRAMSCQTKFQGATSTPGQMSTAARLSSLRGLMKERNIDVYSMPTLPDPTQPYPQYQCVLDIDEYKM